MSKPTSSSAPSYDLNTVLEILGELARKSEGQNYIYRGERKPYTQVSSTLYREYKDIEADSFDIEVVQEEILAQARLYARYTGEIDDFEILSQLQHNGGATNFIDFTSDYLIALFFACDGEPNKPGRVILLSEAGEDYDVQEPVSPVHRVIAQKSLFVRPSRGFIEPDDVVNIEKDLKPAILEYLRSRHGISTETIYNDLHGFIRHRGIHQSAYTEFYKGVTSADNGDIQKAIKHYTNAIELNSQLPAAYNNRGNVYSSMGNCRLAIADYEAALALNPEHGGTLYNLGYVYSRQGNYHFAIQQFDKALGLQEDGGTYCIRGEAWLHLAEWGKARDNLSTALEMGADIVASFRFDYENVADFEQQTGLTLPEDIAEMLGG